MVVAHNICNVDFQLSPGFDRDTKVLIQNAPIVTVAFWYMNTKLIKNILFSKNGEASASAWIDTYSIFFLISTNHEIN
jgi:hypothetical protein